MGIGHNSSQDPFVRGFGGWFEPQLSPEFDLSGFCHLEGRLAFAVDIRGDGMSCLTKLFLRLILIQFVKVAHLTKLKIQSSYCFRSYSLPQTHLA